MRTCALTVIGRSYGISANSSVSSSLLPSNYQVSLVVFAVLIAGDLLALNTNLLNLSAISKQAQTPRRSSLPWFFLGTCLVLPGSRGMSATKGDSLPGALCDSPSSGFALDGMVGVALKAVETAGMGWDGLGWVMSIPL